MVRHPYNKDPKRNPILGHYPPAQGSTKHKGASSALFLSQALGTLVLFRGLQLQDNQRVAKAED